MKTRISIVIALQERNRDALRAWRAKTGRGAVYQDAWMPLCRFILNRAYAVKLRAARDWLIETDRGRIRQNPLALRYRPKNVFGIK